MKLLFGHEFQAAAPVLAIHIWALLFVFLGVAREQYLLLPKEAPLVFDVIDIRGRRGQHRIKLRFIPGLGPRGAAIATVISYGVSAVGSSLFYKPARQIGIEQLKALFPFFPLRRSGSHS